MAERGLATEMVEARGYEVAEWTWLADVDPEFMASYNALTRRAFGHYADRETPPDTAISIKTKELIAIALLAGQRDWERFPTHLERLVELGATDEEILETLQIALVITGGPALRGGVEFLRRMRAGAR